MLLEEKVPESVDSAPGGGSPRRPRAYWPVALLMLGLVLALLGAAFMLDQHYRTQVGVDPASVTAPPSPGPATTVPQVGLAVSPVAAATSVPTTAPTAISPSATGSAIAPTAVQSAATPRATVIAAASPVPSPAAELLTPIQKEIADAYLRYWDIRINAYFDADPSQLKEVMAGAELAREEQQVAELAAQRRAVRVDIEHHFRILKATDVDGLIFDQYVNRSRVIDKETKRDLVQTDDEVLEKISYQLQKVDGVWKVVDGARQD